jgi:hypothetical protein
MNNPDSSLVDLVELIRSRAEEILEYSHDDRTPLEELFEKSIKKTMDDIKRGANSDDFADLVVITMIIEAAKEGYSASRIKKFVDFLAS